MPARDPGRLVALCMPPGPRFAGALEEAWEAGDVVLPLDPALPRPALRRLLRELRPAALRDERGERPLAGGEPVAPGAAAVVATSGSAGPPKGVELTHGALAASVRASVTRLGTEEGDSWLCCLPLHHVAGLTVLLRARLQEVPVTVHPRFDATAVARAGATLVSLVPTMLVRLLEAGADLRRFRRILLGGAPAPRALLERAAGAGASVVTTYGMTETCGGCVYDGRPLDGVQVRLGADGRVHIRGDVLMRGYRSRPDETAAAFADGWLRTSDLGHFDADGRLRILGRADRVIVTGGENVVAEEVEALLASHPRVAEAAVVGRGDAEWGQRVVAVVVPVDASRPPALPALREHVAARAPAHAAPRELVVVAALPRLTNGKVDYAALPPRRSGEARTEG